MIVQSKQHVYTNISLLLCLAVVAVRLHYSCGSGHIIILEIVFTIAGPRF